MDKTNTTPMWISLKGAALVAAIRADMTLSDDAKLALLFVVDPEFRTAVTAEVARANGF